MIQVVVYKNSTGEITAYYELENDADIDDNTPSDCSHMQVYQKINNRFWYVDLTNEPVLAPRPEIVGWGVAQTSPYSLVLNSLPVGSTVYVTDTNGDKTTYTLLTVPVALAGIGLYLIQVVAPFPYQAFRQTITLS